MARYFFSNAFNIIYIDTVSPDYTLKIQRAERLARELINFGVTGNSSIDQVITALREFAEQVILSYGVSVKTMERNIDAVLELIRDCYEDYLLPHILAITTVNSTTTEEVRQERVG